MVVIRVLFSLACVGLGFFVLPGGLPGLAVGALFAGAVITVEMKLHAIHSNVLMGGVAGTSIGLMLALGFGMLARQLDLNSTAEAVIQGVALLMLAYLGMVIGALKGAKGEWWIPWKRWAGLDDEPASRDKILDTSVLIDGRVVDIIASGFVEGAVVVPKFVLEELQQVADSSDSLKRARGRRGLDIVQRLQQQPELEVRIDERDFPKVPEVDHKLIALASKRNGVIVTNDFNLGKVAVVRGVSVLNINELANAVKPAYLPGEQMSVYIVKEGKEAGQGVGYLDDGTMVVVDSAREDLGSTVTLVVTSVLQTSAGKMIFGKKAEHAAAASRQQVAAVTR